MKYSNTSFYGTEFAASGFWTLVAPIGPWEILTNIVGHIESPPTFTLSRQTSHIPPKICTYGHLSQYIFSIFRIWTCDIVNCLSNLIDHYIIP